MSDLRELLGAVITESQTNQIPGMQTSSMANAQIEKSELFRQEKAAEYTPLFFDRVDEMTSVERPFRPVVVSYATKENKKAPTKAGNSTTAVVE